MDYGKALTFITEDPRWTNKVAIGTGLVLASMILSPILVGIVGYIILAGYAVRLFQNVRDGAAFPLPEWDQWGDDLVRGFKLVVVGVVWALPALILAIPYFIGTLMTNAGDTGATFGGLIMACTGCLSFLYWLFYAIVTPGFFTWFAEDEQISSGLQFTEIWSWTQEHIGQVIATVIVVVIASVLITVVGAVVGAILCVVGLIVTIPLASLVTNLYGAHLYGQLARAFPPSGRSVSGDYTPPPTDLTPVAPTMPPAPAPEPPPAPITPVEEPPAPAQEASDIATSVPPEEPLAPESPDEGPQPPVA